MPEWLKITVALALIIMGLGHQLRGLFAKQTDYGQAAYGVALLLLSFHISP